MFWRWGVKKVVVVKALQLAAAVGDTWGICKGYCSQAGRGVGCRAECGTSRRFEVFSLLCNK